MVVDILEHNKTWFPNLKKKKKNFMSTYQHAKQFWLNKKVRKEFKKKKNCFMKNVPVLSKV